MIVKTCQKHGELISSQVRFNKYKGKIQKKCIQCINERSKKYYDANRELKREKDRQYWALNKSEITKRRQKPERLAKRREWTNANYGRYATYHREKQKQYKENLAPSYVKKVIQSGNKKLNFNLIPTAMVELKMAIIQARRQIKKLTVENRMENNNVNKECGTAKRFCFRKPRETKKRGN